MNLNPVILRRFDRPGNHSEAAMKAELAGLPCEWRIYASDITPTLRRYYVEFQVSGNTAALTAALDKIGGQANGKG